MTANLKQGAGGAASQEKTATRKRRVQLTYAIVTVLFLVILVAMIAIGAALNDRPADQPPADPGTSQGQAPAPVTPPANEPVVPATLADQASGFYTVPAVQNYFAHVYGGGEGDKAKVTWSDQRIINNFNSWWDFACRNSQPQALWGIFDMNSERWKWFSSTFKTAGPHCGQLFNVPNDQNMPGIPNRSIRAQLSEPGGSTQAYLFAFVPDCTKVSADPKQQVGIWVMVDEQQPVNVTC
jgi:hypothetical protein